MTVTAQQFARMDVAKKIESEMDSDLYRGTAFYPLKSASSKKKGKWFEEIYSEYMKSKGHTVEKPNNSDHDRIVDNRKKEIKGSFMWEGGTHFRWQQIRPSQDYDDVVFIAIYPDRIDFFEADKETVRSAVEVQNEKGEWIHNQHGGKKKNSGTFFLDGFPTDFAWMTPV
jgi:hypothetical protein